MKHETKLEKIQRYHEEGRGDWWFYPLWKKIAYVLVFPFILGWLGLCWLIMKLGHGLYVLGDWMSGWRWDGDWMQEV